MDTRTPSQTTDFGGKHGKFKKYIFFSPLEMVFFSKYEIRTPNDIAWCFGTDANRNWGYKWNTGGSSDYGCQDTYHGTEPFSEPETRYCSALTKSEM